MTSLDRYGQVVRRIAREHRTTRGRARRRFDEMVRYLDLCGESPETLAPSKKVDKAWHEFLLFTREYAAFCESRYGRFIHHEPHVKPDPEAYRRTYDAYTMRYGAPPRWAWPNPYKRGGGCGGGAAGDGDGGGCGGGGG